MDNQKQKRVCSLFVGLCQSKWSNSKEVENSECDGLNTIKGINGLIKKRNKRKKEKEKEKAFVLSF